MQVLWISFPFLPQQKDHLGLQSKNFLSFPWGTFYLGPAYPFSPFLATASCLVLYAAMENSLVQNQLQIKIQIHVNLDMPLHLFVNI